MLLKVPEILAPVGTFEMCQAAVHNGADAIYVGMPEFNARGRAPTLSFDELGRMINYCHSHGVKVFVAFNVLIFERELTNLIPALMDVLELGPDAFIVQDIGLARLIRAIAPTQALHASTQMTVTCAEAIELTSDIGFERYVLGREVSIPEMQKIRAKTDKELEVFVHGALCVSYSGQCLTSERMGGRSANRGQCAQSCRLPYELIVDGIVHDTQDRSYLVSPKDLCALEDVPRLIETGIDSFKIEGRLKSPEYVASAVRSYKEATLSKLDNSQARVAELTNIYSRGFFNGWMDGVNHQKLVDGRYGNHHGLEAGIVVSVERNKILIATSKRAKQGDGVVFVDFAKNFEIGGPIYGIEPHKPNQEYWSFADSFEISKIIPGMIVFINSSPSLDEKWRKTYLDKSAQKKIALNVKVSGSVGEYLSVNFSDSIHSVSVNSESKLLPAKKAPLTPEACASELGALAGTCFSLAQFEFEICGDVFIHNKELKVVRRKAVAELEKLRTARTSATVLGIEQARSWLTCQPPTKGTSANKPSVSVVLRDKSQIAALEGLKVSTVYLDFEYGKEYDQSLKKLRELGFETGLATTRILKPGERGHLEYIRRLAPDSVLVRNLGALQYFQDKPLKLIGDFSLNVANSLSANWLLSKRLERICPSYDLNRDQLLDLIAKCEPARFEITVHQYMPAFHMEHCVFAAFLSKGASFRDCGRPCERHRVELRDPQGSLHPLKADAECRNTMFNGVPQSAARLVPELRSLGVSSFRFEALFEEPEDLRQKLELYIKLVDSQLNANEVFSELNITEKYGVSEGQLLNIRTYKDRKKEQVANTL